MNVATRFHTPLQCTKRSLSLSWISDNPCSRTNGDKDVFLLFSTRLFLLD